MRMKHFFSKEKNFVRKSHSLPDDSGDDDDDDDNAMPMATVEKQMKITSR